MTLKHTDFMQRLSKRVGQHLASPLDQFKLGETRWICQVYYGNNKLVHYEISRPSNRLGQQIEIGLHFENRSKDENLRLLQIMDQHLLEIQAALESQVWADVWDRGWTKIYELHPDKMTDVSAEKIAARWAKFISVLHPILENKT